MNVSCGRASSITSSILPTKGPLVTAVDTRPLDVAARGTLQLDRRGSKDAPFVSAASGLIAAGGVGWAISDDLPQFVRIPSVGAPVTLKHGLDPRTDKYDFESITAVPDAAGGATLLAFGSGSKADRAVGMLQTVAADGKLVGRTRAVHLAPLYAALDAKLPMQPNIEGAAIRDGTAGVELLLFHRGKAEGDVNMVFVLDAAQVVQAARSGRAVQPSALLAATSIDLGTLAGARLGFADARALPDGRIAFVASAEESDALGNGAIKGSAFGILDADLRVTTLRPMTGPARKVEGIEFARSLDPSAPANRFLLVTDADDATRASELLSIDV